MRARDRKGRILLGRCTVAYYVPFENHHLGFFTIYDGYFEQYIQDFADKTRAHFRCRFKLSMARLQAQ